MATLNELIAQKAALEKEIESRRTQEREEAVAKVRALMSEHGLTLADLSQRGSRGGGSASSSASKGSKVAAKYRNSATGETWSGRGLQPKWLKAAIASGKALSDFAV
jgi:DNA-binding protein H-NS